MSAWRRKALASFPDLRFEINPARGWPRRDDGCFSYYILWFRLLSLFRDALETSDEATLRRIFDLAHWCFRQDRRAPDLNNAVCVSFYEHVFDVARNDWPDVARFISPDVVRACRGLWEWRLSGEQMEELRRIFSSLKIEL